MLTAVAVIQIQHNMAQFYFILKGKHKVDHALCHILVPIIVNSDG